MPEPLRRQQIERRDSHKRQHLIRGFLLSSGLLCLKIIIERWVIFIKRNCKVFAVTRLFVFLAGGLILGAFAFTAEAGEDGKWLSGDKGLSLAKKLVNSEQYQCAIPFLSEIAETTPDPVEAYVYLGHSYRELGELDRSLGYYMVALGFDPDHRSANKEAGQVYLQMGDLAAAEEHLARLGEICPAGCEERASLKGAVEAYRAKPSG